MTEPTKDQRPPKAADRFLSWFCRTNLLEEIKGDLHEYYLLERQEKRRWKANLLYWYHVLHFLRPFALKRRRQTSMIMYASYFKYAFRNIRLNLFFSLINVIGLGIGLAACILIFQYLSNEWSYDKFHADYENIYRIQHDIQREGILLESATTFSALAPTLKATYPSVEAACRLHKLSKKVTVKYGDQLFLENKLMGADSNFFSLFNFPFLYGSPQSALRKPGAVVLTASIAQKYFGDTDPIGQEISLDGAYGFWGPQGYEERKRYEVSGVIEDLPANTHFDFDFLISFNLYSTLERELKNWGDAFYTYVRLNDAAQSEIITPGLVDIVEEYRPDQGVNLSLQALQKIHLTSNLVDEIKPNGNEKATWLLAAVAVIILLVAGTNYINFSTAKAIDRRDEVGVRKIFGAKAAHLFQQLQVEAFILNVLSLVFAFLLIWITQAYTLDLLGFSLADQIGNSQFWLIVLGVLVLATFISGLYPALSFSRQKLDRIIGKKLHTHFTQSQSRNFLVVFQFSISILVIGSAIVLYGQMNFMNNKDLGIDINHMLVLNGPNQGQENDSLFDARISSFKTEVQRLNEIQNTSLANFIPGKEISGQAKGYVRKVGDREDQAKSYSFTQVDFDFIPNFDIELLAGRTFDPTLATDQLSVIINKEACQLLGFTSAEAAIGQKIVYRKNSTPTIIGVMDDFHQYALQRNIQPIIFEVKKAPDAYYYLKLADKSDVVDVNSFKKLWEDLFPGSPFNYFFLDDFYASQYNRDHRFMKMFGVFSLLAIFVASMGFFGLTYYTAANRVKEIGIRKTFGATFQDIFMLLSKGLGLLIILSGLIGIPLLYYIAENWLLDYAFRIAIKWWMLLAPVFLLLMVTLLVVTIQSIQSNRLNPVVSLREK